VVDERSTPWWQTIPGALSALAAVLTAITGLIVVLRPAPTERTAAPPAVSHVENGVVAASTPSNATPRAARQLALPNPVEVRLAHGDTVVRVLSARLEPYNTNARSLVLTVRYTNNGRYPANFWTATFRLLVDDVPRAPTNDLNKVVDGQSAAEGDVVFEIPATTRRVTLRILSGDEHADVPLDVTTAG
jgi:hypothetical protein